MTYAENTILAALSTPLPKDNDAGVATVGEYLFRLLADVWKYDEGFDGKRPFGNSGWCYDLYMPLAEAGLIKGRFTYDSQYDEKDWYDMDDAAGDRLITAAIRYLFRDYVTK